MTNSSNININVSSLTDRIDLLAQKLTAVESQLGVIQTTIPTNLPEFTDPIPVTLQNPSAPTDTSTIEELLGEIKAAIENLELSNPSMPTAQPMLTSFTGVISPSINSWNVTNPTDINNAVDKNPSTVTGWGQIQSGGTKGWFQFDLENPASRYTETKLGIRMAPGHEGGNTELFVEISVDGQVFYPVLTSRIFPTGAERVLTIPVWMHGRYLRIGVLDNGGGQPQLRIHEVRVWNANIPTA